MAQVEDALNRSSDRDHEGGEPTSRQIQADIDRTRSNMDRTFDAIESKLTPSQLLLEVWGLVKGGSGAGANKAWRIAKQHPLPAAVIGLGVGWLLLDSSRNEERGPRRGDRAGRSYGYDDRHRYSQANRAGQGYGGDLDYPGTRDAWQEDWRSFEDEGEGRLGAAKDAVKSAAGSAADFASHAKDKVSDLASQAGDKLGDLTDKVKEQASDLTGKVKEQASDLTDKVKEQASQLGDRVQEGTRKARLGFWQLLEERPLVVGAATLAVGLLAGLSVPRTDVEDDLMGETRDQLLDSAKETGRELLDKGKTVASAAVDAVQHAAEENEISVDKLADKVKAVASEAKEAVKNEAQKQNLTPEALLGNAGQQPGQQPGQGQNAGAQAPPQNQQNQQPNRPPQSPPGEQQGKAQPQPGKPAEVKQPQAQEVHEPELAKR